MKPDEHFTSDKMIDKSIVKIDSINNERREKVKEAMLHAWNSYEKYAWGQDELQVCYKMANLLYKSFS